MAVHDHANGEEAVKFAKTQAASEEADSQHGEDLHTRLHMIHQLQQDCLTRIRHLEDSLPSVIQDNCYSGPEGDVRRNLPTDALNEISFCNVISQKGVDQHIYAYKATLDKTNLFLETTMRDLLQRRIRQECTSSQTESVAISAREVGAQTSDDILEDYHVQKLLFSLPDLEQEIANLRLDIATQTELQMDHFLSDDAVDKKNSSEHVVIIYRNPSMASFLWPYLIRVGGGAFALFTIYSLARFALSFRPAPTLVTAPAATS